MAAIVAVRQKALACLLYSIIISLLIVSGASATTGEAEIISTESEILAYVNHTAKLSCVVKNKNRHHVTWSRVTFINATQKLNNLLFVDLLKYTPLSRYHTTHMIERDNIEYWNLEIRNVHTSDQGYYSCVLTAIKPISKLFHVKVVENTRNPQLALRSTSDPNSNSIQKRSRHGFLSSLSLSSSSIRTIILMIIFLLIS